MSLTLVSGLFTERQVCENVLYFYLCCTGHWVACSKMLLCRNIKIKLQLSFSFTCSSTGLLAKTLNKGPFSVLDGLCPTLMEIKQKTGLIRLVDLHQTNEGWYFKVFLNVWLIHSYYRNIFSVYIFVCVISLCRPLSWQQWNASSCEDIQTFLEMMHECFSRAVQWWMFFDHCLIRFAPTFCVLYVLFLWDDVHNNNHLWRWFIVHDLIFT